MSLSRPNYRTNGPVNGLVKVKSPGLVTPCSNGVEARGCEQLAQSRYAAASWPGLNSRPLDHKSDTLPLRHHATPVNGLVHRPAIYTVGPTHTSPTLPPSLHPRLCLSVAQLSRSTRRLHLSSVRRRTARARPNLSTDGVRLASKRS